jgi:preprotein translocase subunit SecD
MNKFVTLTIIIVLTAAALLVDLPVTPVAKHFPIKFGLDLQGGIELELQTQMDKIGVSDRDNALESARSVIERRVNAFGVSESVVQSSKVGDDRRILVDLPGVSDASAAAKLVGQTAQLEFRELSASGSASPSAFISYDNTTPTGLTGSDLKKADVVYNSGGAGSVGPQVSLQFSSAGAQKFADITKRNIGKPLPIFLDSVPVSSPVVQGEILGGNAVITGNFTPDTAKTLSIQLNAGALPVPIKILSERQISASLGAQSVQKSLIAGIIGLSIIMIYMAVYYGFMGLVADLALLIYTSLVFAVFKTGLFILPPVTLTLAGIAGFILSIGMAVDANILIFERMKEERRWGKDARRALELGFSRAWSSIRDSNISSLITAFILYYFGTGLVRGFAITLAVGVLISMFTAVVVTRTLLKFMFRIK